MDDLSGLFISPEASLREAIALIDSEAVQVVLAVSESGALVGTVTDGDIRRGLLSGLSLESAVNQVMFKEFRSLPTGSTEEEALSLMRKEVLRQIPVLDENGFPVRLFLLDELIAAKSLPNTVVIMAGGIGKRLQPLTHTRPKPMLDVAGKPILEIIIDRCVQAGLSQVIIAVSHLKQQIIDFFGDGSRWGIEINYLEEEYPMGTAGALGILKQAQQYPLLVINGDVLTRVNINEVLNFHNEHKASATICVREYEIQVPYGVVTPNGVFMESIVEKPVITHLINAGIYVIEPDVLSMLTPSKPMDMPELIELASSRGRSIGVFPIHEFWLDLGSHDSLAKANDEWLT